MTTFSVKVVSGVWVLAGAPRRDPVPAAANSKPRIKIEHASALDSTSRLAGVFMPPVMTASSSAAEHFCRRFTAPSNA
jgi:hypothetical protein